MKIKRLKDYKITRLIFLIFAIFQFCNLAIYSQPKDGYVLNVEIGSTTTLTWKVPGDYTGYDSLYFAVKACTTSSACGRLVGPSKSCSVTYQKPYTTVTCSLFAANTAGFNSAKYFWSIYAYGSDTVAVRSGVLNLQLNGQTDVDGIATNYPVYLIAIDSSDQEPGVLINRNSTNTTDWWSLGTLADSLHLDTSQVSANFDSIYSYWVNKHETQTITGQKNFMGTVKFSADTSMQIGTTETNGNPVFIDWQRNNNYNNYSHGDLFTTRAPGNDTVGDWTMSFRTWEFLGIMGHGMYFGFNQNYRLPNEPIYSFVGETPYRYTQETEVYEWYWSWQNKAVNYDYAYRPWGLAIYYYRDSTTNAPLDSIPLVHIANAVDYIDYQDKDRNFISRMNFSGNGISTWMIYDTTYIYYGVNNSPWLRQATSGGGSTYLPYINDNDNIYMPDRVEFGASIVGDITWDNYNASGTFGISVDTTNKIKVGGSGGMQTQSLDVTYFPDDTTDLVSGKIYVDPNNGDLKYTIPQNLISNGDFTQWADIWSPADWSVAFDDSVNRYVEESPAGKLHFVYNSDNDDTLLSMGQSGATIGVTYGYSFNVVSLTGLVDIRIGGDALAFGVNYFAGKHTGEITAIHTSLFSINAYTDTSTCDLVIDDIMVWVKNGSAKQATYDFYNAPVNLLAPTTSDTLFLGCKINGAFYDSLMVVDVQDSIAIQGFYDDGSAHNLITTVDTLTSDATITFDQSTIPDGAKVYLYFVYLGDSEAYLRSQIYWRE